MKTYLSFKSADQLDRKINMFAEAGGFFIVPTFEVLCCFNLYE